MTDVGADDLQFDKAEFQGTTSEDGAAQAGTAAHPCSACTRPLDGEYWEVGTSVVCGACRDGMVDYFEGGSAPGRVMRSILLGGAAAAIGAFIWYLIIRITDYNIGIVAIAVGWMVGRGVVKGSRSRGGWFYQALAVGLTYVAIGAAMVPIALAEGSILERPADVSEAVHAVTVAVMAVFGVFALPVGISIEAPISGLIFGFALWQAFKMNRKNSVNIAGPFRRKASEPPVPPSTGLPDAPTDEPPQPQADEPLAAN